MTSGGRLSPAQRAELTRRGQEQFRRELAAQAEAEARRLTRAYQARIRQLDEQLALARLAGEGSLYSARSIERAREQVTAALNGLTRDIEAMAREAEAGGVAVGARAGSKAMQDAVGVGWNQPSVEQIRALVSYVDSGPFQAALNSYGSYYGDGAADIILDGVSRGVDPVKTARQVTKYLDTIPRYDALRTVRTVQLYSARQGSHEIFRQNADVVSGWMWCAARGGNVCMACLAQDGKIFPLSATLNDHHLGRCAPVPVTKKWSDLGFEGGAEVLDGYETGLQRFGKMTDAEQQAMMGKGAWQAWKDGRFTLDQYARPYQNSIYGTMIGEASLKDLIGEEAARLYTGRGDSKPPAAPIPKESDVTIVGDANRLRALQKEADDFRKLCGLDVFDGIGINAKGHLDLTNLDEKGSGYAIFKAKDEQGLIDAKRWFFFNNGLPSYIKNDHLFLDPSITGNGLGTQLFATQVKRAKADGFTHISTIGGRGGEKNMNGYYTWPRLGYDGALDKDMISLAEENEFWGVGTVSELMQTKSGREYWKENGDEIRLRFDLEDDSYSMMVLDAYLEEKGLK